MKQPKDPFPIYKDGESKLVHGVDYEAWAFQGWSLEPKKPLTKESSVQTQNPVLTAADPSFNQPTPYQKRLAELNSLIKEPNGWRNIERIAKQHDITQKPAGGWDEAIPLILENEGLTE